MPEVVELGYKTRQTGSGTQPQAVPVAARLQVTVAYRDWLKIPRSKNCAPHNCR